MDISDFTAADLQDDIIGPFFIEKYREEVSKRKKNDKFMKILAGYANSIFQDFESYLRTEVDLVEADIRLVSMNKKQISPLMNYHRVFTLLTFFPRFFLGIFNSN